MEDRYLYKAKWIDTGEWVDGNLIVNELDTREYFIGYIFGVAGGKPHDLDVCRVDPSTICQCTGLKDKNGRLIWENDIVKINGSKTNSLVCFKDFEVVCTIPDYKYYRHRLEYGPQQYEIIGNIFDNPELLKSEG